MKYQSRQHAIENAQAAGSSAKTFKGAVKFLVNAARDTTPLHRRGVKATTHNRGADALRKLPRWRLAAKANARAAKLGVWARDAALELLAEINAASRVPVPLGPNTAHHLEEAAWAAYPHRKNWDSATETCFPAYNLVETIDHGQYSSRCQFRHLTYRPTVTSCAVICDGGSHVRYEYAIAAPAWLKAPRGYRWDRDKNGLRIVSMSDQRRDYHPNSDDLRSYDARALAKKAAELHAVRKAQAAKAREEYRLAKLSADEQTKLIAKAEREGATVCLKDSIKAGNCRAGSEQFAQRHNLDPTKHYRPSQLLRIANGDAHRVKLVVAVALRRHRHEMAVGYALLEDHRA